MKDLAGDEILAGALTGRKILHLLLDRIHEEPQNPEPVYLDFQGITVATASFLRECVIEFKDIVRRRWTSYYPVVANANASITEELSILLGRRDVLLLCTLDEHRCPASPRLVGELEPKQQLTFDLVKKFGEVSARDLMDSSTTNESIRQTAWNNRLASLNRLGLLVEISHGRIKRYRHLPLGN